MCSQKHYLSASDARKLTDTKINNDVGDSMSNIMGYIKEAIALNDDYISVSYDEFHNIEQNLRDLEYSVTITFDKKWMNIRW